MRQPTQTAMLAWAVAAAVAAACAVTPAAPTAPAAAAPAAPAAARISFALVDGSLLNAVPCPTTLVARVGTEMRAFPLGELSTVQWTPNRAAVVMGCRDGRCVTGVMQTAWMAVDTLCGRIRLGMEHVLAFTVRPVLQLPRSATDALLFHYDMDDAEGQRMQDRSGRNRGGLNCGAARAQGKVGGAFAFDGAASYIYVGSGGGLDVLRDFTIATWVSPQASGAWGTIIARGADPRAALEFGFGRDDALSATFWSQAGASLTGVARCPAAAPGGWMHVALEHDGSRAGQPMRMFINGEEVAVDIKAGAGADVRELRRVNDPWRIGCVNHRQRHLLGRLDEFMMFSRALSAAEVQALYGAMR